MLTKRAISISFSILVLLIFFVLAYALNYSDESRKLIVFYSPACHKCIEVKNKLMPEIEKEFKGKIKIQYIDIDADIENYKFLLSLKEKYESKIKLVLPIFYFEGQFLSLQANIKSDLRRIIAQSLNKSQIQERLPTIDLVAHFQNFKTVGIITAGLGDGINPCAFTVIVFFISYLALQGYRKKELFAIGFSFISAVFLTYLLIGLGLFNIIYSLEKFLLIRKIFNISIGISSIMLGILSVYDVFKLKKTGHTEGLILQLPKALKKQIHSVIGWHYRKSKEQKEQVLLKPHIFRLIISALVTGFLVSFLELVCTGQLYLPTIKFALKTTPLKLQALGYLLLYNSMFIVPLLIIFLFALLGITSEQFSKILKKHLSAIKILMALLFFGLGIFLLWRP